VRLAERERQRLDRTPWSKSNTKKRKREEDKISQKEKRQKLLLEQEKAERDKQAEWDELAREARLIKKEKKSKRKRKHAKKSTDDAADDFDDDEDWSIHSSREIKYYRNQQSFQAGYCRSESFVFQYEGGAVQEKNE